MSENTCRLAQQLSPQQAQEIERHLLDDPHDLQARRQLLIYYMMQAFHSQEARTSHQRHLFWVIRHHPGSPLAGSPLVILHRRPEDEGIQEAKRLWAEQVQAHPESATVVGNAAKFLVFAGPQDWPLAQEWLQRAQALDPDNSEWPQQLGQLYEFKRPSLVGQEQKTAALRALEHFERAYELTADTDQKVILLDNLAQNALAAEEFAKAGVYADELLENAALIEGGVANWNYGNALHWGHIVLGNIALRQSDLEAAKTHLREAGNTPGSPQLNSFGPDMSLAKEMLKHGEQEAVLAYLSACSVFWEAGKDRLTEWETAIRQEEIPDFPR